MTVIARQHDEIGADLLEFLTLSGCGSGLRDIIENVAHAAVSIADLVRVAAFGGASDVILTNNIQGEQQKQLDVLANQKMIDSCSRANSLVAMVSEELDAPTWIRDPAPGDHVIYFDPLDGSSNLDANLSVGSIFAIAELPNGLKSELLQAGRAQCCAGYALYGPSTMLVLTLGDGVHGFTFDERQRRFVLTHPALRVPAATNEFAVNMSRYHFWSEPVRRYIDECVVGEAGPRGQRFNMRWTASMVADVHRILMRGGTFLYPLDTDNQRRGGRLRLMYEANPMAWLIEQAGGMASTGDSPILDIVPAAIHQRVSVMLGSEDEISRISRYHLEKNPNS